MKVCNKCKQDKPPEEFYVVTKRGKPTTYHICISCTAEVKRIYKGYARDWELKKKYGISLEEYKSQCQVRGNCCDVCDKEVLTLHVDHSHITGKVRGYLCGSCNRGLGLFQDNKQFLFNAANYLRGHEE